MSSERTIYTGADDARLTFADAAPDAEHVGTVKGYAIVWNVPSSDRGGYRVRLRPGSAKFTANVHALFHHEFRDVLGDTTSGTLRILPADAYGIAIEVDLPRTQLGRDVWELVKTRR